MPTASQVTQDPVFDTQIFWERYKTPIIAVVAILVLGALAFTAFKVYNDRRAADAATLLAGAKSSAEYQQVIDRYAGTDSAASAYLLLAQAQRTEKKFDQANTTLRKFIDQFPKHELITTAWMAVAANLEWLGKTDEALGTYQRLVAEYPQSFNAPLALVSEVPLFKAKNKMDEARKACETILSQYRDSIFANDAMRELTKLPKPAVPTATPAASAPSIPMARLPETAPPAASAAASPAKP